jgi:hypothetical protein
MQLDAVRSELSALWQAWLERVLATLQATGARSTAGQAAALDQLQLLRRFLQLEPLPCLQLAEHAPPHAGAGLQQLCELLQCQLLLRQPQGTGVAPGTAVLLQALQQGLLALAQACRHSDWTLGSCVATGLARQCRELTLLGAFAGDADLAQQLLLLEAQLLLWHAAAPAPSIQQQATMQKQLLALARGRVDLCRVLREQAAPVRATATVLPEAAQPECCALAVLLQSAQVSAAEVDATQMLACYRLAWVLQAAERSMLAQVGLFNYQILVQHWQQRARLPPPVQHLLAAWLEQVQQPAEQGAELPGSAAHSSLLSLLGAALAAWPEPLGTAAAPAPPLQAGHPSLQPEQAMLLALPAAGSTALSMRQLPEYLAASLSVLLQVEESWFVDRASWQCCSTLLYQELQLLEQGAAALRLAGLEHFCSLLLGLYAQVLAPIPQGLWPAALLWQVHHHLVALLDRAALWLEPVPNATALAALEDWLQQGEERCTTLLQHAARVPAGLRLASALTAFGQQAGRLLGRPVRISLDLPGAWITQPATTAAAGFPDDLQAPLLHALQEILRWLLLQHQSSAEQRRSRRQPLATVIAIAVKQLGADACAVDVLERGVLELPGSKALQRLQRSLGPAVEALGSEELPRLGRRVQCSMSAASLQRAQDQRYRAEPAQRQN